jgi:hypothetical protein
MCCGNKKKPTTVVANPTNPPSQIQPVRPLAPSVPITSVQPLPPLAPGAVIANPNIGTSPLYTSQMGGSNVYASQSQLGKSKQIDRTL